eukprot:TRINITY_DN6756_c1_g3_i1.p1 TRINITY_DN6756_c1_g3~~TRINITY_DN6756_c1_g3_i1.p1  ORF type:complete len:650 (+),score=286.15 TRINITY_DN6756_c1_g3_i1:47-1996(+)
MAAPTSWREEVDGEVCDISYRKGMIQSIPAEDGVYEGETADLTTPDDDEPRTVPHGQGTFKWNDGNVYEGEWKLNMHHGKGRLTFADGGFYTGDWVDDQQHGFGHLRDCNGDFEGEFASDERSGAGKQEYTNRDTYSGTWKNDKRHGKGVQQWHDGAKYDGDWADDCMHGRGIYTFENGDTYEGDFIHDQKTGKGMYRWADSHDELEMYQGGFLDGARHGEGIERYKNGNFCIGKWKDGKHDGEHIIHQRGAAGVFALQSVESTMDVKPQLSDEMWAKLEATNKAGEVLEVTLPKALEDELAKAKAEIQKAEALATDVRNASSPAVVEAPKTVGFATEPNEVIEPPMFPEEPDDDREEIQKKFAELYQSGGTSNGMDLSPEAWKRGNLLGQGSFGDVYAGLRRDGGMMAVKCIQLGNIEDVEEVEKLITEIDLMKKLNHTNIVKYLGANKDPNEDIMYIFLEYVPGGSLASVVKKFGTLDYEAARRYTKQICFAIKYLHDVGVIHRDIKGDNILLTGDGIVKLADFGASKNLLEIQAKTHGVAAKSMAGTPYWMAPEVINNQDVGYSFPADIWSIGCTLCEMLTGSHPWPEFTSMWGAIYHIGNSVGMPEGIPKDIPADIAFFLENCFVRDTTKRFTPSQLLATDWMKD